MVLASLRITEQVVASMGIARALTVHRSGSFDEVDPDFVIDLVSKLGVVGRI